MERIGDYMQTKRYPPKCWICVDEGCVIFEKKIGKLSYEMFARCRCKKGQDYNEIIATVDYDFAETIAKDNFIWYKTWTAT